MAQNYLVSDMGFSGLSQRAVSLWPGMGNNLSWPSTTRLSLTLSNYSTSPSESIDCFFFLSASEMVQRDSPSSNA